MELVNIIGAKFGMLRSLGRDERGVTALEYGLVAAFVGVAIVTALNLFGPAFAVMWANVLGVLGSAPAV